MRTSGLVDGQFSGCLPLIVVVKAANLRDGNDASSFRPMHRPRGRRVLLQGKVRPRIVVVSQERLDVTVQPGLAEDDHVVQAFTPNRSDDAFDIGALARRAWRRENLLDAHDFHLLSEVIAKDAVAISQQIPWCGVPQESIPQFLSGPLGSGMRRERHTRSGIGWSAP